MAFLRRFARSVTVLHEGRILSEGTSRRSRPTRSVREVYLGRSRDERSRRTWPSSRRWRRGGVVRLEIDDVHVAYGRTEVLFGVSLEVPDGSLVCLMGRNGVGKTTLLNAVMGLLPVRSGAVRLDGDDLGRAGAVRAGPGRDRLRAPGPPGLPPAHACARTCRWCTSAAGAATAAAIDEALDVFPAPAQACSTAPAGLLSRRPGPAAGHRPGPGDPAAAAGPRRADRGHPAVDHPRDRGRHRRAAPVDRACRSCSSSSTSSSPCAWPSGTP